MNGGRSHPDDHVTTSEVRQHLAQSERSRDRVVVAGLIQAPGVAEGSKSAPSAMTMMSASKTPESVSTRIASGSIDRGWSYGRSGGPLVGVPPRYPGPALSWRCFHSSRPSGVSMPSPGSCPKGGWASKLHSAVPSAFVPARERVQPS